MPTTLLSDSLDAIEFVTNPFALTAFVLVVILVGIGLFVQSPKTRTKLLVVFGLVSMAVPILHIYAVKSEVFENSLFHVVREAPPIELVQNIEISLVDIETLKGKKNWEFNSSLIGGSNVYSRIMEGAGLPAGSYPNFASLNNKAWRKFIEGLEDSDDVEVKLQAEKIKDTPFAKFRVLVDGTVVEEISGQWFFKGDQLPLEDISIEIANIYNTKHHSSGEREAANVRVLGSKEGT
jgi:hypothetical protein